MTRAAAALCLALCSGCARAPEPPRAAAPASASAAPAALTAALEARLGDSAHWLPEGWREGARRRRVPGSGLSLLVPEGAQLRPGRVELGGGLVAQLSLAEASPAALATRLGGASAALPGALALRAPPPAGLAALGGGGLLVLVPAGASTVIWRAVCPLPAADDDWARVAALLATTRPLPGQPSFAPDELGFALRPPRARFASLGPEGVLFSSALPPSPSARRFSAGLHRLRAPAEPEQACAPEALLPFAPSDGARVLTAGPRAVGALPGCEAAAIASESDHARFEYAALGFEGARLAALRVSLRLPADTRAGAIEALAEARRFADGYRLSSPSAPRTPSPGP